MSRSAERETLLCASEWRRPAGIPEGVKSPLGEDFAPSPRVFKIIDQNQANMPKTTPLQILPRVSHSGTLMAPSEDGAIVTAIKNPAYQILSQQLRRNR